MIGISERQALDLHHIRSAEMIAAAGRHRRAAAAPKPRPRLRRWRLSWPGRFTVQVTLSTGRAHGQPDYT
jgi:hypothetical protein